MGSGALVTSRYTIVKRIVWPARASLFALIGGAVGLFGDLANFFTEFLSAPLLVALFAGVTVFAGALCLQRALLISADDTAAVDEVVQCAPCDAFRFGLFATAAFMLLMLIGQGGSATEAVGRQLGLIQQDVSAVRRDVSDLHALAQPQMIVRKPKSAADHFNNAWLYRNMHRDSSKAFGEMQALYATHAPRKLDAAQLYFDSGVAVVARAQLVEDMLALGRKTQDATLLVIAARASPTYEIGTAVAAEARRMDPELPFAWWDIQRPKPVRTGPAPPAQQAERLRADQAEIETFRRLYGAHPAARFFFLPQHQPDFEALARQTSENLAQNIATYDDIASGALAARTRAAASKAYREAQAKQ